MKINKNNYEIFVIDFLEGNLSKEQMRMFQLFLNENPDINEEIIDLNEATLPLEEMIFNDKDILKKDTIRELDKIDFLLAKKLEGDLNSEEDKFVEKLLASDESIRKSWSLMKKITLSPEVFTENFKSLKFPDSINYTLNDNLLIGKIEGDLNATQTTAANNLIAKDKRSFEYLKLSTVNSDESIIYPHKEVLKKTAVVIPLWKKITPAIAIAAMLLLGFLFFNNTRNTEIAKTIDTHKQQTTERTIKEKPLENNLADKNRDQLIDQKENKEQEVIQTTYKVTPIANKSLVKTDENNTNKKEINNKRVLTPEPLVRIAYQMVQNPINKNNIEFQKTNIIKPNTSGKQEVLASNISISPKNKEYKSFRDFATEKAKETLWGDEEYPEENYTAALIEKTVDKVAVLDNSLPVVSKYDNGWEFRFKKFSIQRKKS